MSIGSPGMQGGSMLQEKSPANRDKELKTQCQPHDIYWCVLPLIWVYPPPTVTGCSEHSSRGTSVPVAGMVATASLLGRLGNSISLWTSKQGDPTNNVCLSTTALSHVQGESSSKRSYTLTFRVDGVAEQAFILEQIQG